MILPHHGQSRPLIFGEVLFDTFPDGARVLGGAPFNVAWHLQGFGADPLLISAVGDDQQGEEILQLMGDWNMDARGVQIDGQHPTGVVAVSLIDEQPSYDIVPDQAYDFIDRATALSVTNQLDIGLLYHGSLAIRNKISRETLHQLCTHLSSPRCVDINLRAPWWNHETVTDSLGGAYCVKLNDDEFFELAHHRPASIDELQTVARDFHNQYDIQILIITRGVDGALLVTPEAAVLLGAPVPVTDMVDTVGAGDAFSAVVLLGLLRGWDWPDILNRALDFAAKICAVRGATIQDRSVYASCLAAWGERVDD